MTREVFTPTPTYSINGVGPYTITHPYRAKEDLIILAYDGTDEVEIGPADFSVDPPESATTGSVLLSVSAAATHSSSDLMIQRKTRKEQGWAGQSAREVGLEGQLDALTMGLQDLDVDLGRFQNDAAAAAARSRCIRRSSK